MDALVGADDTHSSSHRPSHQRLDLHATARSMALVSIPWLRRLAAVGPGAPLLYLRDMHFTCAIQTFSEYTTAAETQLQLRFMYTVWICKITAPTSASTSCAMVPLSRMSHAPSSAPPEASTPTFSGPTAADNPNSLTLRSAMSVARRMSSTAPTESKGRKSKSDVGHTAKQQVMLRTCCSWTPLLVTLQHGVRTKTVISKRLDNHFTQVPQMLQHNTASAMRALPVDTESQVSCSAALPPISMAS